jgi:hypothetical protein
METADMPAEVIVSGRKRSFTLIAKDGVDGSRKHKFKLVDLEEHVKKLYFYEVRGGIFLPKCNETV